MSTPKAHARKSLKILWISAGILCVGVGVIGIFVPGLPTTVFLLLASWMFARSSERMHRKLHGHPQLGPYLEMARQRRMPTRARVISLVLMWGGITTAILFSEFAGGWIVRAVLICAGLAGTSAILSMRSDDTLRTAPDPR